jgi:GT2 family glycosyltransferase
MTGAPRVLVGILNYNAVEDCIETAINLRALDYPAFDLLVLDNASTNDAANRVQAACPWLTVARATTNTGYAGGMNALLDRGVAGDYAYVLLCNNDIAFERDALTRLVATARAHPAAAVTGVVEVGWTTNAVRCVGGVRHGLVRSRTEWSTSMPDEPVEVAFPQGAALLVECAAVRAGLRLDDRLFMYFEEADLGFRLRAMGRTAVVDPSVRVRHKADSRHLVPRNGYLQQRNRIHLVRAHGRPWQLAAHILYAGAFEVPLKAVVRTLQGHRHFARAIVMGFVDGVRGRTGPGRAPTL